MMRLLELALYGSVLRAALVAGYIKLAQTLIEHVAKFNVQGLEHGITLYK